MAAEISAIVPAHNAERTLPALLGSLRRQDIDGPFEVIVVDDASTDDTLAVTKGFAGLLPLEVVEAGTRRGPGAARNAGAARASSPRLAFCDADDAVNKAYLRSMCAALRRHPLVAAAIQMQGEERPLDFREISAYFDYLPWSMSGNLGITREVFCDVGGFAEELRTGEDADLCWRLAARGVELAEAPDSLVFKGLRSGPVPTFRQYYGYGRDHPLLFRRHRSGGMPRASAAAAAKRYKETAALAAHCVRHPRSPARVWAAQRLGQDLGRLIGSFRWRSLYL